MGCPAAPRGGKTVQFGGAAGARAIGLSKNPRPLYNASASPRRTAVADFRFRARYEPQLRLQSIRATPPDPLALTLSITNAISVYPTVMEMVFVTRTIPIRPRAFVPASMRVRMNPTKTKPNASRAPATQPILQRWTIKKSVLILSSVAPTQTIRTVSQAFSP